jgi:hypothetical protein
MRQATFTHSVTGTPLGHARAITCRSVYLPCGAVFRFDTDFHAIFAVNYVCFRPQRHITTFTHSVIHFAPGRVAIRGSSSASRPRQYFCTNFDVI